MKIAVMGFLILISTATALYAGETREIELNDGSVITGEVQSLSKGIYTIKSETLGTLRVEESKIKTIRPVSGGSEGAKNPVSSGEVRALQDKMMNDKDIMNMIQSLKDDPEFQKILEDPEVVKAVQAGDLSALMANPRFMKLLDNSTVHEIEKKVK